jgi:hypothetical protein
MNTDKHRYIEAVTEAFLPLMKGEMKRGLGPDNLPLTPSFMRRGKSAAPIKVKLTCFQL